MIARAITYYGIPVILVCDARCDKAWGINSRPRREPDHDDFDDVDFLSDTDLGIAPIDPGTYEGTHAKPRTKDDRLNKWCARECERSRKFCYNEEIVLPTFGED